MDTAIPRRPYKSVAHALPMTYEQSFEPAGLLPAALGVLLGAGIVGIFAAVLRDSARPSAGVLAMMGLGATAFLLFAGAFAAFGLQILLRRERFVVTPHSVLYRRGGLWGAAAWEEPLKAYRGVLLEELDHMRQFGDNRDATTCRILLKHAQDAGKDLELYGAAVASAPDRAAAENEAEALAQLLGVALLRAADGGGFSARAPDELDKPLAQRAAESRAAFPSGAPLIPAGRLRVEKDADGEDVVLGPIGGPPALACGIVLAAMAVAMTRVFWSLGALAALMSAVFLALGLGKEAVRAGGGGLRRDLRLGGLSAGRMELARAGIKDVFLFRAANSGREVVRIAGADGLIDVGQGFTADERRWLKDFLLARLAS